MHALGLITLESLRQRVAEATIDTVIAAFPDLYGRLMGKRFDASFFLDHTVANGTHACDYLLTVDMEMEPVQGYTFSNWERGYGDFHLVPDFGTLRLASWLENTALVLCDVQNEANHQLVAIAPRSILHRQIAAAQERGFEPMTGSELEYYLYRGSYREAAERGHQSLDPVGWYLEDYHILQSTREEPFNAAARRHLRQSGIPVETSKGEWGRGQHELNVRYAGTLAMADNHAIYKQCLKEIADAQGICVTFMAKPEAGKAGSSCHIHFSLRRDGRNAFAGDQTLGSLRVSDTFRWFLGGLLDHVRDVMPFYAPTVNSYKRFEDGSWAPTRIAWCADNRTAGFRVVGQGESLRIECRIPGADCNPYLAFAAMLASGLDGLDRQIEPPPIFEGDVYAAKHLPRVPYSLAEAIEAFKHSPFVAQAFGPDIAAHYTHFLETERDAFARAVTDWERRRYFERI
ncbi:MAG: glutamine synthetase family protein [Verrucomicrobiales bacterium]